MQASRVCDTLEVSAQALLTGPWVDERRVGTVVRAVVPSVSQFRRTEVLESGKSSGSSLLRPLEDGKMEGRENGGMKDGADPA
jgi:hypothetical protein